MAYSSSKLPDAELPSNSESLSFAHGVPPTVKPSSSPFCIGVVILYNCWGGQENTLMVRGGPGGGSVRIWGFGPTYA